MTLISVLRALPRNSTGRPSTCLLVVLNASESPVATNHSSGMYCDRHNLATSRFDINCKPNLNEDLTTTLELRILTARASATSDH
jgi:hypothetical protein